MPSSPPGGLCPCSTRHSHAHRSAGSGLQSATPPATRGCWPGPAAQRPPGGGRPHSQIPCDPEPGTFLQAAVCLLILLSPQGTGTAVLHSRYRLPHFSWQRNTPGHTAQLRSSRVRNSTPTGPHPRPLDYQASHKGIRRPWLPRSAESHPEARSLCVGSKEKGP